MLEEGVRKLPGRETAGVAAESSNDELEKKVLG